MAFDCIWMDLEHHSYSLETANSLIRAARIGTSDIVARPGKGEFMRMGRLLEAGATGIMYPRCSNAEEAREIVKWSKFYPEGERGFDGSGPDNPFRFLSPSEYVKKANEETFIIAQLEEQKAVDQADEIINVPGIDGLMLGPADFSILSDIPGDIEHDLVYKAMGKIANAAKKRWQALGTDESIFLKDKRIFGYGCSPYFSRF